MIEAIKKMKKILGKRLLDMMSLHLCLLMKIIILRIMLNVKSWQGWKETIVQGIENAPKAFLGLFTGENFGKMLVKF